MGLPLVQGALLQRSWSVPAPFVQSATLLLKNIRNTSHVIAFITLLTAGKEPFY